MKFRNKKTGEIAEWDFGGWYRHMLNPDDEELYECTLSEFIDRAAKFREDWEDAPEEPKKYWFINSCGVVEVRSEEEQPTITDMHKQFGNYFETEEEAIKARERQFAWTRLKDKGFRFEYIEGTTDLPPAHYRIIAKIPRGMMDCAEFLFGGEE